MQNASWQRHRKTGWKQFSERVFLERKTGLEPAVPHPFARCDSATAGLTCCAGLHDVGNLSTPEFLLGRKAVSLVLAGVGSCLFVLGLADALTIPALASR